MKIQEEIKCYHCRETFYLNNFRFQNAKTVSCYHCDKRIIKNLCYRK